MVENTDMDTRQLWQSQNFLKDREFVSSLVEMTSIGPLDTILEIGPGKGIITQQLAKRAKKVIGIEYDPDLARKLRLLLSGQANVAIIEADFLRWNLPEYPYKVFSNIPFNMTADIVNKLLFSHHSPQTVYLIMQDKAAERFMGRPVAQNDSQVSILLQPFYDMSIVTRIDRRQFEPVPSVNTVLAKFDQRKEPLIDPKLSQQYRDFIVYGYNQWKPTVLEAFEKVFTSQQRAIIAREISIRGLRPSDLTIEQWLQLFKSFLVYVPEDKKVIIRGAEQRLKSQQKKLQKQHRTR